MTRGNGHLHLDKSTGKRVKGKREHVQVGNSEYETGGHVAHLGIWEQVKQVKGTGRDGQVLCKVRGQVR